MDKFLELFNSMDCDKEMVKKIQDRLFEMAKTITAILDKNNIDYFIFYGTLLGAVRHGGFIPWDDDFDIYIMDDVYDEAIQVLKNNLPKDMLVEDDESEPLFFHAWARVKDKNTIVHNELSSHDNLYQAKGLNFDIFRAKTMMLSEVYNYRYQEAYKFFKRKLSKNIINQETFDKAIDKLNKDFESKLDKTVDSDRQVIGLMLPPYVMEIDEVFPLQKLAFNDVKFKAPINPDSLLKKRYGNYMELPNKDEFRIHFHEVKFLNNK